MVTFIGLTLSQLLTAGGFGAATGLAINAYRALGNPVSRLAAHVLPELVSRLRQEGNAAAAPTQTRGKRTRG